MQNLILQSPRVVVYISCGKEMGRRMFSPIVRCSFFLNLSIEKAGLEAGLEDKTGFSLPGSEVLSDLKTKCLFSSLTLQFRVAEALHKSKMQQRCEYDVWPFIIQESTSVMRKYSKYPELHLEMCSHSVEHFLVMKSDLLCWAGVWFSWASPYVCQNVSMSITWVHCSRMVWWSLEKDCSARWWLLLVLLLLLLLWIFICYYLCNITCWNTE